MPAWALSLSLEQARLRESAPWHRLSPSTGTSGRAVCPNFTDVQMPLAGLLVVSSEQAQELVGSYAGSLSVWIRDGGGTVCVLAPSFPEGAGRAVPWAHPCVRTAPPLHPPELHHRWLQFYRCPLRAHDGV